MLGGGSLPIAACHTRTLGVPIPPPLVCIMHNGADSTHSTTLPLSTEPKGDGAVRTFRAALSIPSDAVPEGFKSIFLAPRGPFVTALLERLRDGAFREPYPKPWYSTSNPPNPPQRLVSAAPSPLRQRILRTQISTSLRC